MSDINVNINAGGAEEAARRAEKATEEALAAAAAAAVERRRLLNASMAARSGSYMRGGDAYLEKLRFYQSSLRTVGATTFRNFWSGHTGANTASPNSGARYYSHRPAAQAIAGGGRAGRTQTGSGGAPPAQGGGFFNNLFAPFRLFGNSGYSNNPLSGWQQAGIGTNRWNFSGGTGIGGNFGKAALKDAISSAKARSVWNLSTSLGSGTMPVVFRTALSMFLLQKFAQIGNSAYETGMANTNAAMSDNNTTIQFSENITGAMWQKGVDFGKSVMGGVTGVAKAATLGLAGMSYALNYALGGFGAEGAETANRRAGQILKNLAQYEGYVNNLTGRESAFIQRMGEMAKQDRALVAAAEQAKVEVAKYAQEFASRNADELAALGFGTGTTIRSIVMSSDAYKKVAENAAARAAGGGDIHIEPSDGDD